MCDLMSSPSVFSAQQNTKQTNIISSTNNGQNINCNSSKCVASSLNPNGSIHLNNPKINKLLADYKQIVLELSKFIKKEVNL